MGSVISSDFGGMKIMSSATSEANIIKGQAGLQDNDTKAFARKLKEAKEKADQINTAPVRSPEEDKKLREVCQEMEAVFLNMMMSKMRDTIPERTLYPKSSGEKIMQSMMDVEITRNMSQKGGIGLGQMLYNQLSNPGVTVLPDSTGLAAMPPAGKEKK